MFSKSIKKLIDLFSKFPTVGPRTAGRFVFYLIKLPKEKTNEIIQAIKALKEKIKLCKFCFKPFEEENKELCEICSDQSRNKNLLCLVEKENDLETIEKTQKYKGFYFILGSSLAALRGASEDERKKQIRMKELEERIKNPQNFSIGEANFQEIIIATNPTTEGEATSIYLEKNLKSLGKKTTRLGRGLPMGGELEYADEETLSSALDSRR